MSYPTIEDLKLWLRANSQMPLPATTDDVLTEALQNTISLVEGSTGAGRRFVIDTPTVRRFDWPGVQRELWLNDDLCEIVSVTNGDGAVISASDYVTIPRNTAPYSAIELKRSASLRWTYTDSPESAIAINGYWGYSRVCPSDVRQAVLRIAAWIYRQKDITADSDRPLFTGDGVTIMPAEFPGSAMAVLRGYRRRVW